MKQDDRSRLYAASGTLLAALLVLLWLLMSHLSFVPMPGEKPGIAMAEADDEEFVEVLEEEPEIVTSGQESAPAENPVEEDNNAQAAPAPGPDLTDNGPQGPPPPQTTSTRPSPVKSEKPKQPTKEEIAAQEKKKKEEEAKRKAAQQTANAFANASGKNNTDNRSDKSDGNAGKPTGKNQTANGVGVRGSGGGKWGLPRSTSVVMSTPGKITFTCTINTDGSVSGLDVVPAATDSEYVGNSRVINALKAEIKAFIKRQAASVKETEPRTARIVYTVK
ncbi:MAG: hypothetical protein K2G24_09350 [Muribaculaceae bacterium]|nr:hypothetical protein [Muribaculaceae bacterium]